MKYKYKMTLIGENGIKVSKLCRNERECDVFERDMPVKYELAMQKPRKWYVIQTSYLENQQQ